MSDKPPRKRIVKKTSKPAMKAQWARPVSITVDVVFEEGSRKVTPADLEKAALAGAGAIRSVLENRSPAYNVASVTGEVEYKYVQSLKPFSA